MACVVCLLIHFQGLFLLWLVCDRRFNPHTIEQFRENIKRSEDVTRTALSLTELIEQHGDRGFIDPIVDDLGPRVTLQLQDMADFLEVLTKYVRLPRTLGHGWRSCFQYLNCFQHLN